ncbi:cytochrome P450 [Sistotremastrum niveocremeum HHB9708]|uniref:Cytochrome P450 n=1 Tax=Sistotremastrum niveocremeum HHB9708 TaxID=1314777 RepID=A0A164Q196_9AGAM|nr:cytochrome P450 [Sistotremastrum niveocremeum HHB9708]
MSSILAHNLHLEFDFSYTSFPLVSLSIAFGVWLVWKTWKLITISRASLPLPPGPVPLPIIGNLHQMSVTDQSSTFLQWQEIFGDLVYVNIFGTPTLILNSYEDAKELLGVRSQIYSDRPRLSVAGELVGWNRSLVLGKFGERHRTMRRLLARSIGGKHAQSFRLHEEFAICTFLLNLLEKPRDLKLLLSQLTGSVVLDVAYGHQVKSGHDQLIFWFRRIVQDFYDATAVGSIIVDMIPALTYLHSYIPFTSFKKTVATWRAHLTETIEHPFSRVKEQLRNGIARTSYVAQHLSEGPLDFETEDALKYSSFNLYAGGMETLAVALSTFFFVVTKYPAIQQRAQQEIDNVTEGKRLPTSNDRERLPFVEAVMLEVLRWSPITPTSLPHRLEVEDIYKGYRIPQGAVVYSHPWAMSRDKRSYTSPHEFRPDRFLETPKEPDPRLFAFGFGRRICPGKHIADDTLFLAIALTLATCNVTKRVNEAGDLIEPIPQYTMGVVAHMAEFDFEITSRSDDAIQMLTAAHTQLGE